MVFRYQKLNAQFAMKLEKNIRYGKIVFFKSCFCDMKHFTFVISRPHQMQQYLGNIEIISKIQSDP